MDLKEFGKQREMIESQVDWNRDVPERQARWKGLFEGDNSLENDERLKGIGVADNPLEVAKRRRIVECLMDNFGERLRQQYDEQAITTSNVATFTKTSLAMIRKIWPRLFAFELCSVQPMNGPNTRAFTVDFRYDSSGGAYAAGTSIYASEDPAYSDDLGEGVTPRKLDFNITGATISSSAKKLLSDWTIEAEQDAKAQHNFAVESEIVKKLSMQIEREVNRELINNIDTAATTNTNWDSTQPASPNAWANATPRQYNESIFDAIMDADKELFTRVYEHGNVLLCGPNFGNRLRKLNQFRMNMSNSYEANIVGGPNLFGTLNQTMKVFVDPFYTTDKAILAHKSNDWLYTGYVHLPYIPMWKSDKIPATNFTFARGLMTRYGNYAKNGDFFATVTVT